MANSSFSDPKCCLESLFEEYNDQTMDEYDESDSTTESRRLSFKNVTTSDIPKPECQHKTNTDSSNRSQLFTPRVLKKTIKLKPLAEITNKQVAKPNESTLMNSFEEDELNTSFLSCESTLPSPPTLPLLSSSQGDSSIPIANHNRSQSCSSSFYSALFSSPITKTPLKLKSPPHINYYHPTRVICDELTDAQILKRRNKRNYGYKSFFTPGVTFSNDINESVSEPSSTSSQEYRPRGKARKFITQDHWTEFQDISKDIFGSR